jgi:hypothetical protein
MPPTFLAGFPKTARAAYPIIRRGVAEGLSGRAIERRVRDAGLKISRGRSIDPIRKAILKLEAQGRGVRFIPSSSRINVNRLPPAITAMNAQYRYRIAYSGIDPSGRVVDGFTSYITDNDSLTPDMIEGRTRQSMGNNPENYPLDNIEVKLEFGEQRAGIGDFTETRGGNFLMQGGAALNNRGLSGTILNRIV